MLKNFSIGHWCALLLMVTIGQYLNFTLPPSFPEMAAALHGTYGHMQWLQADYLMVLCVSQLICGAYSDHIGRRNIVLYGYGSVLIGSILSCCAHSIQDMMLARLLQGVGVGAISLFRAVIRDIASGKRLAYISSIIGTTVVLSSIVCPVIGSIIQHYFGWHGNVLMTVMVTLLGMIISYLYLPETYQKNPTQFTYTHVFKNIRLITLSLASGLLLSVIVLYGVLVPYWTTLYHYPSFIAGFLIAINGIFYMVGSVTYRWFLKHHTLAQSLWCGYIILMLATLSCYWALMCHCIMTAIACLGVVAWGISWTAPSLNVMALQNIRQQIGWCSAFFSSIQVFLISALMMLMTSLHWNTPAIFSIIVFMLAWLSAFFAVIQL
jgi:MFS family permease